MTPGVMKGPFLALNVSIGPLIKAGWGDVQGAGGKAARRSAP